METMNDAHAGEIETSTSLATRPHLVALDWAQKAVPSFSSRYLNFKLHPRGGVVRPHLPHLPVRGPGGPHPGQRGEGKADHPDHG